MKKPASLHLLGAVALATLALTAGVALAEDDGYARKGVINIGGTVNLEFGNTSFEGADTSTVDVEFNPAAGYFVADNLEVFGELLFGYAKEDPDGGESATATTLGVFAGAAYWLPAGFAYVGPRALIGYSTTSTELGDSEVSVSSITVGGGGALRVPVHSGGLIEVAAELFYQTLDIEINDASGDGNDLSFNLGLGYLVYF